MTKSDSENSNMTKYAIIQTGGKQYQALEGKTLGVEKLEVEPGQTIQFEQVLLRKNADSSIDLGAPYLATPVTAVVIKHLRGPKIVVFKFKRRKKYMKKQGHRQWITVVRVQSI